MASYSQSLVYLMISLKIGVTIDENNVPVYETQNDKCFVPNSGFETNPRAFCRAPIALTLNFYIAQSSDDRKLIIIKWTLSNAVNWCKRIQAKFKKTDCPLMLVTVFMEKASNIQRSSI